MPPTEPIMQVDRPADREEKSEAALPSPDRPIPWLIRARIAFVRGFLMTYARCFGLSGLYKLGQAFATMEYLSDYNRRRRVHRKLAQYFGDRYSPAQRRRITWRYFMRVRCDKMFYTIMDRIPRAKLMNRIKPKGQEHVDAALDRGKGVYLALCHFGAAHVAGLMGALKGYDIAGVVEKTGANVTRLKVGDAVYGYPTFGGGWANYVAVKEWEVAAKPKSLNFVEASAVPMGALTAWQALVDVAKLQPGQTILIHGGSGGVGSFAVQIAKARGARVIATASTANQDLLKQLGADVAVDYTKTNFEDVAKDVDAVLDPVGKETLARSYGVVKKGGIVMSLVARPDPAELQKHGIRGAGISVHPDADDLTEIAQLIDAGKIKPIVTEVLPLTDAVKAQQQAATHHTRGKVVLRIAEEPKG